MVQASAYAIPAAKRAPLAPLQIAAYVAIIVGVLVYTGQSGYDFVRAVMGTQVGQLTVSGYSGADAAHFTLTNERKVTMFACLRAVVENKQSHDKVSSVVVCTGDMKPRTTVVLEAPYPYGSVLRLCSAKDRFGIDRIDWDQCSLEFKDDSKMML